MSKSKLDIDYKLQVAISYDTKKRLENILKKEEGETMTSFVRRILLNELKKRENNCD